MHQAIRSLPHIVASHALTPACRRLLLCTQAARQEGSAHVRATNIKLLSTLTPATSPNSPVKPTVDESGKVLRTKSNFCRLCGSAMSVQVPEGEKELRHVCPNCGYIDYFNPKMVVGCIVEHEGRILLCRRSINPCKGLWTLPAGYLELHESSAAGAVRETLEEANAMVQVLAPYAHLDIPVIGQTYIIFRAKLSEPYTFSPGPETLETAMVDPKDVPFDQLAFSSISIVLQHYLADLTAGRFHVHHGVIDKLPGSAPNDPNSFVLRDHFAMPIGATTQ